MPSTSCLKLSGQHDESAAYNSHENSRMKTVLTRWKGTTEAVLFGAAISSGIAVDNFKPVYHSKDRNSIHCCGTGGERDRIGDRFLSKIPLEAKAILEWVNIERMQVRQRAGGKDGSITKTIIRISSTIKQSHLVQILEDPPPFLFIAACILFACAIATLRQSHRTDRYQDRIMGIGAALGIAVALKSGSPLMSLKGCLAWWTLFALAVSITVHYVLGLWSYPVVVDNFTLERRAQVLDSPIDNGSEKI